ncbi:MAG: peptide chain release factor N(5)-glutamine methyltransferase [Bacilli bacterium]|nr:peptide chain release factor N(5)-glutamine methyltransferase [Bacilli bacterium]
MKYNKSDLDYLKKYINENKLDNNYYNECLKELEKGKPIQYIIGNVDFYGNIIKVNPSVLIPRFETELLVDLTIKKIKNIFKDKQIDILDLGTGSGCIAITLKKEINSNVDALDISSEALMVAKTNAKENNVEINFIHKDMTIYKEKKYDVIISNPPYIRYNEEIMDIVKNNEPHLALYANDDGLYFYKEIIKNIPNITKDKYLVCFEIGESQSTVIVDIAKEYLKDVNISVHKDYSDKDRFIFITNEPNN